MNSAGEWKKVLPSYLDDLMNDACIEEAFIDTDEAPYRTESADTSTRSQLHDLARLIGESIAALDAVAMPAPEVGIVRHVSADDQFQETGIAVDVKLGQAVVCLFAPDWLTRQIGASRLRDLAELFVQRVREVHRARQRHVDRLAQARRMIDAAIERSSAGMTLISLKTTPQRVDANLTGCQLGLEATISMLNDALKRHEQRIVAWTPREMAKSITCYGPRQRECLRASLRMKASGAVLEIDALAERSIAFAGANLVGCANALLTSCDPHQGLGQGIILSENADGRTSVYLRLGRIIASVWLFDVGLVSGHSFMVDHVFPEAVTEALAGRSVTSVIDHPLLRDFKIASAQRHHDKQTLVQLNIPTRFISASELDETAPLPA